MKAVELIKKFTTHEHNCLNGCKKFEREECPVFRKNGRDIKPEDLANEAYEYGSLMMVTALVGCEMYEE